MKIKVIVNNQIVLVETNPYVRVSEQEAMTSEQLQVHWEALKQLNATNPDWSEKVIQ